MIRVATPEDYVKCQEIALACFDHNIARYKNLVLARMMVKGFYKDKKVQKRLDHGAKLYVADESGVKGFIEIRDDFYISNIFVSPNCQRSGLGRQLMAIADELAGESEDEYIEITLDASKDAIHFYEKCGFKFLDQSKSSFGVEMFPMKKTIEKKLI